MPNSLGEIIFWPSGTIPKGWMMCDGQQMEIEGNEALYELIGVNYGGDGRGQFALPDLRGRRPVGANEGQRLGACAIDTSSGDGTPGYTAVGAIMCTSGTDPGVGTGTLPTMILPWPSPVVPRGWLKCDGQLLPISGHPSLFSLIGTTYGGDGRTTFGLPDLRGRVPVGAGQDPNHPMVELGETGSTKTGTTGNDKQGYQTFQYIMNANIVFPGGGGSMGDSDPFIGTIIPWASSFAPRNWALCHGQLMSIMTNEPLFSLVGTTYGGDGRVTFALPDLRGRFPIGIGQGKDLPNYENGQSGQIENKGDNELAYAGLDFLIALAGVYPSP